MMRMDSEARRARATQRVLYALKKGRLARLPCEECGEARAEAHHDDYARPLDVRWLCHRHHRQLHARLRDAYGADLDAQLAGLRQEQAGLILSAPAKRTPPAGNEPHAKALRAVAQMSPSDPHRGRA